VPGVLILGTVFGTGAVAAGIAPLTAVLMSALVYSGATQFAILPLWRDAGTAVLVLTAFVLSLRFSLMAVSAAPGLVRLPRPARGVLAFWLTDETYALAVSRRGGKMDPPYLLGAGVLLYLAWIVGTVLGVWFGASVPSEFSGPAQAVFPIAFVALTALCCATRTAAVVAVLAAVLSVGLLVLVHPPAGWNVMLAGLATSLAGPLLERFFDAKADRDPA
jgi:predicted branched-subunit amino acid permease